MSDHPPVPAPISTVTETPRKLDLVTEPHRPEPTVQSPSIEAPRIVAPVNPRPPEPELSLGGELDLPGVGKIRGAGAARGTLPILALHRLLIVLGVVVALVAGAVAIVAIVVRAPGEHPRRPDLGRCTEHIERTPHAEYIERTCEGDSP